MTLGFGKKQEGEEEKDDLFEEALEDALCVFKSSGANTDLLSQNEKQILFYVDLDEEEIIERETYMAKKQEEEEEDVEQELDKKPHPMLFN